ncbi:MAG: arginine--tRNA ligase [bacterium]
MLLDKIKQQISQAINKLLGQDLVESQALVYPPDSQPGDLCLPCFGLAKALGQTPVAVAQLLAEKFSQPDLTATANGPYFNISLAGQLLAQVLPEIDDQYGVNTLGQGQKVMIEYSNVNTHKEYHIGHLRNIAFGDSIDRLLLSCGYDAIPVTYVNDFGIHVAKTLWAYQPEIIEKMTDKGYGLGQIYVTASEKLEKNEVGQAEVAQIMKNIESRQGQDYELWEKTRQWSLDYFQSIYQKLQIKFERSYYESQYLEAGLQLVKELLAQGILKASQGAVIADLEEYDLGVLVIIRSDGTALYPVADLALAQAKFKEKISRSIYIVDNRQTLYFRQLFKILELMGHHEDMVHLTYDFVKLPSGMMRSRTGNTVPFQDLYDQVSQKIKQETKSRHEDWSDQDLEEVVKVLTVSILKFEMLKISPNKIITFDINEALRFDGYTAVYLQYAVARINSILRQEQAEKPVDYNQLQHDKEKQLLLALAKYPDLLIKATQAYEPSVVAKYLFDLARLFNDYYHEVSVLQAESAVKNARLALLAGIKQVLQNGLEVLGIAIVEQM